MALSRTLRILPLDAKRWKRGKVRCMSSQEDTDRVVRLQEDLLREVERRSLLQEEVESRRRKIDRENVPQGNACRIDASKVDQAPFRMRSKSDMEGNKDVPNESRSGSTVRSGSTNVSQANQGKEEKMVEDLAKILETTTSSFDSRVGHERTHRVEAQERSHDAQGTDSEEPREVLAKEVMNIVMVAAECAPWSKTGGLGDVASALPKALARRGHRVMCVAPRYSNYEEGWETGIRRLYGVCGVQVEVGYFHSYTDGVDYIFVDHPAFHHYEGNIYGGSRDDLNFRCALLCKAALEAPWHVPCGGTTYGDDNLVYIANDWHTSLLPVYLQAHYRDHGKLTYARSILVIHNIAHQGRGPLSDFDKLELPPHYKGHFYMDDPVGGVHCNIMKAGFLTAHRLVAVSHGYAWECQTQEGGWGLDGVLRQDSWKLRGIVNGIDEKEWNPSVDKFLTTDSYQNYDVQSIVEGKRACKLALQRQMGLPENPDVPLIGFIGRLDYQKGVDLIRDAYWTIMSRGAQLIMLGTGSSELEDALRWMESANPDQCKAWVGFNVVMAHRITAGCDMLLMPSRFEPCGLNQLYALAYGTVPIVHAVGGLRDTVPTYDPWENSGLGWAFEHADVPSLEHAVHTALDTYYDFRDSFVGIQKRGMEQDLGWDHAAQQYEDTIVEAKYQW